jgi:hypothetical protein
VDDDGEAEEPSRRRRFLRGRRLVAAGAVVVLAGTGLAFALTSGGGDGGGGAGGAGSGSSDDSTSMQDAALQFAQCMRNHGVKDFPDPKVSGNQVDFGAPPPDVPRATYQKAKAACQDILDKASPAAEQPSQEELAKLQDESLAMAQCMRKRGWDMSDPQVSQDGGIRASFEGVPEPGDPRFDEFEHDQEACMDEAGLPTPGEGGGVGGQQRDGDVSDGGGS